jgi:hypothetical protein
MSDVATVATKPKKLVASCMNGTQAHYGYAVFESCIFHQRRKIYTICIYWGVIFVAAIGIGGAAGSWS